MCIYIIVIKKTTTDYKLLTKLYRWLENIKEKESLVEQVVLTEKISFIALHMGQAFFFKI